MEFRDLQRQWDAFGKQDPYWAILTDPARRGNRWDVDEFFATGRTEMAALFEHAARLGVPRERRHALDFGCGAGRLTQALATYVDDVVGVDVAPSMIALADRHNRHGARCRYEVNDRADLSRFVADSFDVVYTGRVLQHMAPRYAEAYIREFVRVLRGGGYLSFDLPSEHGFFAPAGAVSGNDAYRAHVLMHSLPPVLMPSQRLRLSIEITNAGSQTWTTEDIAVGNHWLSTDGLMHTRDDGRAAVRRPWPPGDRQQLELDVTVPAESGRYRLQIDLVHEGVTWFADVGSTLAEAMVLVGSGSTPVDPHAQAATDDEPHMEMHAVPRARVEQILRESGATLLDVRRVDHCGPMWLAFRYDVTKSTD